MATLFPEGGGYASFLHGKVVDMLYFPMFAGTYPDWLPFKGGEPFLFFKPVFNLADTSITIGVLNILIFQRSFFSADKKEEETTTTAVDQAESIQEGELSQKELENKEGVDANQSREEIEPKE